VIIYFRHVTQFAFVLTSVGLEHEGHEVLAVTLIVNVAVCDDALSNLSDGVADGGLPLKSGEREGGDRREQLQNQHGDEGRVFTAYLILSPPGVDNPDGIGSVTNGVEVVTKSDATDDVHGGEGGIVKDVDLEGRLAGGMDLVGNARLEGGGDMVDVGMHFADVIRREGGSDETTHALVVLLTLDPEERAATESEDE